MRKLAFIAILAVVGAATACILTGADGFVSAPVGAVCVAEKAALPVDAVADTVTDDDFSPVYTLALTGDIMMGTTWPDTVLPAKDGRLLFKDVRSVLRNADVAVGNLEGTLCDTGTTKKRKAAYNYAFRTPLRFAPRLSEAGFDFLSMANNHSLDFGWPGVLSTEQALRHEGILYAGLKGRRRFSVMDRGDVRFGFCAFGHNHFTLRMQELSAVKSVLDTLRRSADIIVVSVHAGAEGTAFSHLPEGKETYIGEDRGDIRAFAHFCIDNGADVIYAHGPHVVRCVEVYKERFIAYSLGNFCTPYGVNTLGKGGYAPVIEVVVDTAGRFVEGQIHSFIQKRGLGPRRDTANTVARHIRELTVEDISQPQITIADNGKIIQKQR